MPFPTGRKWLRQFGALTYDSFLPVGNSRKIVLTRRSGKELVYYGECSEQAWRHGWTRCKSHGFVPDSLAARPGWNLGSGVVVWFGVEEALRHRVAG